MTDAKQQCPESFLDVEAFARLEEAGNVKLSAAKRAELNGAISYSVRLRDWHEAYPPQKAKKNARARVAKCGDELKKALFALDEPAFLSVVLSDDEGFVHFMEPNASSADPQQFMEQLDAIIERGAWRAPYGRNRKPGRPSDMHLVGLCVTAAKIYEAAGGRSSIYAERTGPFAEFVRALNAHIPKGYRAGSADQLVKHAQKALSRLKNQRERAARARTPISQKSLR